MPHAWDEACQNAFKSIKKYLLTLPVLAASISDRPLTLCIATLEGPFGALLVQNNDNGKKSISIILAGCLWGRSTNTSQ